MPSTTSESTTVAVVGAGFGGIGMGIQLKRAGIPFVILEKAERVGGVWRDNTYPGAACDIPSHLYSFSFERRPHWTRKYAPQEEIRDYLEHCARTYGLDEHIRFGTEVTGAEFDEDAQRWQLTLERGDELEATFLVMATGQLSRPAYPRIPGLESFTAKAFHSARWDHDHDLRGKRVAVIGTGASAIQFVPEIAGEVAELKVFQRSAAYVMPKPDRAYRRFERRLYGRVPAMLAASRARLYASHEVRALAFMHRRVMKSLEGRFARHLRKQVPDERLRAKLTPDYPFGCKRVLISNDWYPALQRDNVELVTAGIQEVRGNRIIDADGREHEVDAIIFGTGFKASEFLAPIEITGLDGRELGEAWRDGAEAHLGICVAGFPNMFVLYGPNTNLGHNSIVYMLESQIDYVLAAMRHARASGGASLQVREDVQAQFNRDVQQQLDKAVWAGGCTSWYLTASGRNTNNWPGFSFQYRRRTRAFDPAQFEHATEPVARPLEVAA